MWKALLCTAQILLFKAVEKRDKSVDVAKIRLS